MDPRTTELLNRSEDLLEQSRLCAQKAMLMNRRLHELLKESDLLVARLSLSQRLAYRLKAPPEPQA